MPEAGSKKASLGDRKEFWSGFQRLESDKCHYFIVTNDTIQTQYIVLSYRHSIGQRQEVISF